MINQQKTWLEFSLTKLISENNNFLKDLEVSIDYLINAENKNFSVVSISLPLNYEFSNAENEKLTELINLLKKNYKCLVSLKFISLNKKLLDFIDAIGNSSLISICSIPPITFSQNSYKDIESHKLKNSICNDSELYTQLLKLFVKYDIIPQALISSPNDLRLVASLHWHFKTPRPTYQFVFSTDYVFGFPVEDYALTAYLNLLDRVAPSSSWSIIGFGADIKNLLPRVLMEGGNIAFGNGCGVDEDIHPISQKIINATDLLESNGSTVAHLEDTHFLITDINNE
jgi:hypothetical protein